MSPPPPDHDPMGSLHATLASLGATLDALREKVADDTGASSDADRINAAVVKMRTFVDGLDGPLGADVDEAKLRHKLRTPVNQILGYSELMIEDSEDAGENPWHPELLRIAELTKRLTGQVDAVLEAHLGS